MHTILGRLLIPSQFKYLSELLETLLCPPIPLAYISFLLSFSQERIFVFSSLESDSLVLTEPRILVGPLGRAVP